MRSSRLWIFLGMSILAFSVRADVMGDARAALAQFRQQVFDAQKAAIANDVKAANEQAAKAEESLGKARKLFEDAGAETSQDADVLQEYAEVLMATSDYDLAAGILERATDLRPQDGKLWITLGEARSKYDTDLKRTVEVLRKAVELGRPSEAAQAEVALAGVYQRAGLHDLAEEAHRKAVDLDPKNVAAQAGVALDMVRQGRILEGGRALDSLQDLPQEVAANLPQSIAEAMASFAQSKRCFPDTAENHLEYAKLLVRSGRVNEALSAAERSVDLSPDDYTAWNLIGGVKRGLGDIEGARAAYGKSLQLKPDQPHTQQLLQSLEQSEPAAPGS